MPVKSERRADLACYGLLAVITAILHRQVLKSFWLFDDLQILKFVSDHQPWEYFFVPTVWREFSAANLTPWIGLSFDIDFALFAFRPGWFYFHTLVSLWILSIMFCALLRLWISRAFALMGGLLFIASAPAAAAGQLLMVRHYIEGAVFALIALFLFVKAVRRDAFVVSVLAAAAYLLAMSAKELYVPLVLIVLFLPEKTWMTRLRHAAPLIAASCVYVIWRFWMLGTPVGGYANTLFPHQLSAAFFPGVIKNVIESVNMLSGD
ncbi:MAG: hypothetical protein HZA17_08325, partial [Nitrospirae bacterium]|nr:hypothetical protein [Nitrospirota bacterium]